jgi:RNA recognition motif-containing protein
LEGRRIYLGNLLYSTKVEDVTAFLADNGFPSVVNVHISIDRFTGRNPGYCFIEFADKAAADDAMEKLEGVPLFDRPVKCRPCQPKGNQRQASRWPREEGRDEGSTPGNNRWGNWGRPSGESGDRPAFVPRNSGSGIGQISKAQEEGRQLYVGGLPRMLDQAENDVEMRDIFKDFEV